jgi:hypothetical protein
MSSDPTTDNHTTDICRRMQEVRCQLGDDVEQIVGSARTLVDWEHYVRQYPWWCLAGAAAIGFLAVPKRAEIISPDAEAMEQLARRNKLVVQSKPQARAKSSMSASVLRFLANAAIRSAVAYAGQNAGKLMAQSSNNEGNGHARPDS